MKQPKTMSGQEFRLWFLDLAKNIQDDDQVFFGTGDLSFSRSKERGPVQGPRLVQIEFNELYKVIHDPNSD